MYAVPKERTSDCSEVREEIAQIMKTKFPKIKEWKSRVIEKNYAFELPIQNGPGKFLEIRYSGKYQPFPPHMKGGETFQHIFGANTAMLEHFIIQKKLMGPTWMTVKNFQEVRNKYTWCDFEIEISHRDMEVTIDDKNRESPSLKVLSFALKTHKNAQKQKEIAMISGLIHDEVHADRPTLNRKYKTFSAVRKVQGLPLPRDFERMVKGKQI